MAYDGEKGGGAEAGLNATQKICAVLRALGTCAPAPLRDISAAAGLHKVTTFRILGTLAQEGFVRRPAGSQVYALGPEISVLGAALAGQVTLRDAAAAALSRLAAQSGDSVVLSVRSGNDAVCIDRQTGDYPIQSNYLYPGTRRPLGVGAGAQAVLAALPDAEARSVLDLLPPKLAPFPGLLLERIRRDVAAAREAGFAVVVDQIVERMGGIAMALRWPDGRVLGAFSILALSDRITGRRDELVGYLRDAVAATEQTLRGERA